MEVIIVRYIPTTNMAYRLTSLPTLAAIIQRFLLKPRVTTFLIILCCLFSLLAVILPQISTRSPAYFSEFSSQQPVLFNIISFFSLNRIFTSIWFLIFLAITTLALFLSVHLQLSVILPKRASSLSKVPFSQSQIVKSTNHTQGSSQVLKICQKLGYHRHNNIFTGKVEYLLFRKGWLGRWGTPLLHSGLILLIIAGIYGAAFYSRAFVQIMEDETITGSTDDWLESREGIFSTKLSLDFSFKLAEFNLELWPDKTIKKMESVLRVVNNEQATKISLRPALGTPAEFNGVTILQAPHFGYALSFMLKPDDFAGIPTSFMIDKVLGSAVPPSQINDYPLTDLIFNMTLQNDTPHNTFNINDPLLSLTISKDNSVILKKDLHIGDKVKFQGYTLYLTDIQLWTGITLLRGYGMPLVYISFLLIFLGCTLHYLFCPRIIYIKLEESGDNLLISMYGKSYSKVYSIQKDLLKISDAVQGNYNITKDNDPHRQS